MGFKILEYRWLEKLNMDPLPILISFLELWKRDIERDLRRNFFLSESRLCNFKWIVYRINDFSDY